jgi:hypothetical protein
MCVVGKGKLFLFFEARKKLNMLDCAVGLSARNFTVLLDFRITYNVFVYGLLRVIST